MVHVGARGTSEETKVCVRSNAVERRNRVIAFVCDDDAGALLPSRD